jgi:hypothetical protein
MAHAEPDAAPGPYLSAVSALNPGKLSTGTVAVTVPSSTPRGTSRRLACADDLSAVAESDESNNCVASAVTIEVVPAP